MRHPGQAQGQRVHTEAVKRSVFASVDQVPGFSSAKDKDHQSRKSSSRRALSQPIPIRSPAGGAVRQPGGAAPVPSSSTAAEREDSPEIEEAQEATPSPEAHAFQSLNSSSQDKQQEPKNGRGSRSSSSDRKPGLQDIPLEDLSRRGKVAKVNRRRVDAEHKRSSSHSPHRGREAGTPPSPRGSPVGARASVEVRRQRKGSLPLAKEDGVQSESKKKTSKKTGDDGVSSDAKENALTGADAATENDQIEEVANDADDESTPPKFVTRSRSSSGSAPPASLTPAPEPTVSLLEAPEADSPVVLIAATDSPTLLPPVETLCSVSDPSVADHPTPSDGEGSHPASPTSPKPRVPFAISTKCPSSVDENPTAADVEKATLPVEEKATDHLSRMALQPQTSLPESDDANDIPLSPTTNNATDELKEQEQS